MRRSTLIAVAGVGAAFACAAVAHEGATGIVKERMDAMEQMGKAIKAMSARIQAKRNLPAIKDGALEIQANAARIVAMFPPGSDWKPTDATPEIWAHPDDFAARARQLEEESAKLAGIADSGDPGPIGAQLRAVGHACAGCHELYRAKHSP